MEFKLNSKSISIGEGNEYALSDLRAYKVWRGDDGKTYAKVSPKAGKPEVYEVEFNASYRGMDGTPLPNVDYFILSWVQGMKAPECVVKSGDKHLAATFEPHAIVDEPAKPRRKRPSFISILSDAPEIE